MPRLWACLLLFSAVGALRQPLIGTRHRRPRARWAPPHPSPPPLSCPRRAHEKGSTTAEIDVPKAGKAAIKIKPAKFHNLRAVSRLLVQEFYGSTLWYPAQCLVELNRLQENFHAYGDDAGRHVMLLATSLDDGSLVGFVDVDGREKRPGQTGVRPYLSDLAVAHRCRRMGIGTELVKACEQFCVEWGYDHMYLKVRVGNVAAQKMYENLGYVVHSSSEKQSDGVGSGFMVETGENPKEVMLCVDLAARARAAEPTSQAEGVVRADSESESGSESESESDKQELSSVIREG